MGEKQWEKLKPGEVIVNKKQPAIKLNLVKRDGNAWIAKADHGEFRLADIRYQEFAYYCKQERLAL